MSRKIKQYKFEGDGRYITVIDKSGSLVDSGEISYIGVQGIPGTKIGINNGKARKFILKFNDIDLTPILTKKQMRDFLKIGAKSLEQILNNNGVIDENMFTANNRSKIISYFNKCVIVELDNESSFFYANNKEVE